MHVYTLQWLVDVFLKYLDEWDDEAASHEELSSRMFYNLRVEQPSGHAQKQFCVAKLKTVFFNIFLRTRMCPCRIYPATSGKGLTEEGFTKVNA